MRKIMVILVALFTLGGVTSFAVPTMPIGKISNTRIVRATADKNTVITYAGARIVVPAGQDILLGEAEDGSIVVRAQQLKGVQVGVVTLFSQAPATLVIDPSSYELTVVQGANVQVVDGNGRMAELAQGASVSGKDIRASVMPNLPPSLSKEDQTSNSALADFLSEIETSSAATRQAAQDVENTLSPSSPR